MDFFSFQDHHDGPFLVTTDDAMMMAVDPLDAININPFPRMNLHQGNGFCSTTVCQSKFFFYSRRFMKRVWIKSVRENERPELFRKGRKARLWVEIVDEV